MQVQWKPSKLILKHGWGIFKEQSWEGGFVPCYQNLKGCRHYDDVVLDSERQDKKDQQTERRAPNPVIHSRGCSTREAVCRWAGKGPGTCTSHHILNVTSQLSLKPISCEVLSVQSKTVEILEENRKNNDPRSGKDFFRQQDTSHNPKEDGYVWLY